MNRSTRILISTMGAFTGLMGVEHGIGEILQGNVAVEDTLILSWPDSPFFAILSGEPAMTILPGMLLTGILAVVFSLAYTVWVVRFVNHRLSWLILGGLAGLMLLFGGGLFPPVLGLLVAAASVGVRIRMNWQGRLANGLGKIFPFAFGACLLAWLTMFPVVPMLDTFLDWSNETFIFIVMGCMFGFLALSVLGGFARDATRNILPS